LWLSFSPESTQTCAIGLGRLVGVKVRDILRLLDQDGWELIGMTGRHRQFEHPVREDE
jgi:predicted RNA binding protein YcfA (HicA-like mRNA interferase family)